MRRRSIIMLGACGAVALALGAYVWQFQLGSKEQVPSRIDQINARLVANGEPTIPLDRDLSHGSYDKTAYSRAVATLASLPTSAPVALRCGPIAQRHGVVAMNYGPVADNCLLKDSTWIVTTHGDQAHALSGILAVYACAIDDTSCLTGGEPAEPGQWQVFQPPTTADVILGPVSLPHRVVIISGDYCFDLESLSYVDPCDWDPERPTISAGETIAALSTGTPDP